MRKREKEGKKKTLKADIFNEQLSTAIFFCLSYHLIRRKVGTYNRR